MKNFGRALLLLTLGLVLVSQAAMAQDALSAILPAPYSSRVGSQLIYFYEDGDNLAPRGSFQSFLTITNTSITTGVVVHFQFYQVTSTTCVELFDFVDALTPGQRFIFNPKSITGTWFLGTVGTATGGRFIMTATPVADFNPADLTARAFNWLSGQIWVNDIGKSATWMTNALPRMAVDALGGPLANGVPVLGVVTHFQYFRPVLLYVNSFFRTAGAGAVEQGVPFGNRLTLFTWIDQYTNPQNMYRILPGAITLNSFVFDNAENAFSVPPRTVACVTEYTISPNVTAGNWTDFLGAALASAVQNTGGWLRMRPTDYNNNENLVGWFSQYLGTFGGGDYLIGAGRTAHPGLIITTTNGAGAIVTDTTTAW